MSKSPESLDWRRSSYCAEGACVEVAEVGDEFFVRNSQQPDNVVRFTRAEWEVFRLGIVNGEF